MKELTHFSLFTGIGGIDLAAEWAGFETVGQCEWADYPTKVLEKHWPDVPRWRDIHGLTGKSIRDRGIREITVLSGGFPCQPHSVAGKRKASSDERDLWPEYRRIIDETRPKWVVAENVRGLLTSEDGRFFRGILRDFADLGFDVGWGLWGACDVGAIHQRERVFVVAHSCCSRINGGEKKVYPTEWNKAQHGIDRCIETASDTNSIVKERNIKKPLPREQNIQGSQATRSIEEWQRRCNEYQPKLLRNFHGIPNAMDRIKCLGNSVVPQQAYPIFKAIAQIESTER